MPVSKKQRSILVLFLTPNKHLINWLYWLAIGLILSVYQDSVLYNKDDVTAASKTSLLYLKGICVLAAQNIENLFIVA